eukprot:6262941-Prymnesium_polylepis.2
MTERERRGARACSTVRRASVRPDAAQKPRRGARVRRACEARVRVRSCARACRPSPSALSTCGP